MRRRSFLSIMAIFTLSLSGCIRESYDMSMLSNRAHLSPLLAVSAIKGDIEFRDIVGPDDTVRFGEDNFVTLVFIRNSVLNIKAEDFFPVKGIANYGGGDIINRNADFIKPGSGNVKAFPGEWIASIDPDTLDLGIEDALSHFTGDIYISNPAIRLNYENSFADPVQIDFKAAGIRGTGTIDLDLVPFELDHPADTLQDPVSSAYIIDKNNSSLAELISMPPERICFTGTALMNVTAENAHNDFSTGRELIGSVEVDIPLELRANNLQFTDTTDNFLADAFDEGSSLNWADFELFRIDFDVKNGFPMGVSLQMNLCDSASHEIISTLESPDVLAPAPVDANGKTVKAAASKTSMIFTKEFFNSIERSDKIVFRFAMNTTGNGEGNVRIYSDYRLIFTASLILKPDFRIKL